MYTKSVFLLVAAMLISPFGGSAMNVAITSARGDGHLLKGSILRYFVALVVIVAVTLLLSLLFGQTIATAQMISTSEVSATAVLLPLAGGVAGALQLVQSERSSLVSGTCPSSQPNFYWKWMMAPLSMIDYIVVHELCHQHYLNHSDAF